MLNDYWCVRIALEYMAYLIECKSMKVVQEGELYYLYQYGEKVQGTDKVTGLYGPIHSFQEANVWIEALHYMCE